MESTFIQCQPDIMGGTPVFADSRVPVRTLVEHLETGETITLAPLIRTAPAVNGSAAAVSAEWRLPSLG